jgi:hypothetical protein
MRGSTFRNCRFNFDGEAAYIRSLVRHAEFGAAP